jgi:hypothetical protein
MLCERCQLLGYCIADSIITLSEEKLMPITDAEIRNFVNVRVEKKEATTMLGKKIQQAHDLFHQDEYEQASFLYLDILQTRNDINEAWAGLAACNYFLAKYDEAVIAFANLYIFSSEDFIKKFTLKFEQKSCESFNNPQNDSNYSDSKEDAVLAYNVTENSY